MLRGLAAELGLALLPHGLSFDRRPTPDRAAPTEADLAAFAAWAAEHTAGPRAGTMNGAAASGARAAEVALALLQARS